MPDDDDFFRQAQQLRLTPEEFQNMRKRIASLPRPVMPAEGALQGDEKSDIVANLRYFTAEFPRRRRLSSTSGHDTFSLPLWRGTNLFRHVHPFFV